MKTLLKILVLVGISLLIYHCTTSPEKQMIKQIRFAGLYNESRIVKVDVLDTIYQKDVDLAMKADTLALDILKDKRKVFELERDSLRSMSRPEHFDRVQMEHNKGVFDSLRKYDSWVEMVNDKNEHYQRMTWDNYSHGDVLGYRVTIHYKNGRTNNFVLSSDYSILCPSFVLDPIDSIFKFKPNMMRRPNIRRPDRKEFRPGMNMRPPNRMDTNMRQMRRPHPPKLERNGY